jgi:hypothetical protein
MGCTIISLLATATQGTEHRLQHNNTNKGSLQEPGLMVAQTVMRQGPHHIGIASKVSWQHGTLRKVNFKTINRLDILSPLKKTVIWPLSLYWGDGKKLVSLPRDKGLREIQLVSEIHKLQGLQ